MQPGAALNRHPPDDDLGQAEIAAFDIGCLGNSHVCVLKKGTWSCHPISLASFGNHLMSMAHGSRSSRRNLRWLASPSTAGRATLSPPLPVVAAGSARASYRFFEFFTA